MLKIGACIQLARGAEEIARQWLEGIFEAIPAQQGGVLLFDGPSQQPCFAAYRDRERGPTTTARTYGASSSEHGAKAPASWPPASCPTRPRPPRKIAPSLGLAMSWRPHHHLGQDRGLIYFDTSILSAPFLEDHLELASSVGRRPGPGP